MSNELDDLYENGIAQMRKQLGPHADQYLKPIYEMAPFFEKINVEFPYGSIYTREDKLDLKTRQLATVAALTVLGHSGTQLKLHLNASLRCGATKEEVIEVICQMVSYCGFPLATQALMVAREVFSEPEEK